MFTVEKPDQKTVEVLRQMVDFLQMPQVLIQFMGKEESFFYYNLHTDPSLWNNRVYLYEMQENKLQSYNLSLNRQTKPVVTLIEKKEYEEIRNNLIRARYLQLICFLHNGRQYRRLPFFMLPYQSGIDSLELARR